MKRSAVTVMLFLSLAAPAVADPGHALREASEEGRTSEVVRLLDAGVPVDSADAEGETPLIEAAEEGHREVLQVLLRRGARVNLADRDGETALIEAAEEGRDEALTALLAAPHVQIDAADRQGRTGLMRAAQEGHVQTVRLLLRAGAAVGRRDHLGRNALDLAAGHPEVQALLRARGAR